MLHPFSYPIVPAIRDLKMIKHLKNTSVSSVFILEGDIFKIKEAVEFLKGNKKFVFIHIDLVQGIGKDYVGVKLVKEFVKADGILTTRSNLIDFGKELGLLTVQRIFLIDSKAFETGIAQVKKHKSNFVEVLPGLIPEFVSKVKDKILQPIVCGGLVQTKEQVELILKAGAIGVSTSKKELWNIY
ncbi:glycerol-3-phosphate responsive antiterminator [Thermosipho ferrireducens]|uniref:Glycerol-3-phosphate responsive antiterminator n=1 Tax=Thermosipho ferrireducens TaxID=2571116 RepID=A0ABX7S7I0_9BACT|nr:glycerol-3-phosphate responsive antiterminator [Thermosipho ferrireducens]QTA37231.1 glycerol-3-phosphate responsive antiterminator [Thermosipho ferrireducens]